MTRRSKKGRRQEGRLGHGRNRRRTYRGCHRGRWVCGGDGEEEGVMVIAGGGAAPAEKKAGEASADGDNGVLAEVGLGADGQREEETARRRWSWWWWAVG